MARNMECAIAKSDTFSLSYVLTSVLGSSAGQLTTQANGAVRRPVHLRDQPDGPVRSGCSPAVRSQNAIQLSQAGSGRKAIYTCPGKPPGVHSTTTAGAVGEGTVVAPQDINSPQFRHRRPPGARAGGVLRQCATEGGVGRRVSRQTA